MSYVQRTGRCARDGKAEYFAVIDETVVDVDELVPDNIVPIYLPDTSPTQLAKTQSQSKTELQLDSDMSNFCDTTNRTCRSVHLDNFGDGKIPIEGCIKRHLELCNVCQENMNWFPVDETYHIRINGS